MADGVAPNERQPAEQGKKKPEVAQYKKWFEEARDALETSRTESNTDRDYYDGKQWTPEEAQTLKRRKQPVQTFNLIRIAVNGMVGVVERGQTDPKAWPRNAPDEQAADLATKTLRYIADQNRFDRLKTRAARNFFVEGICATIIEVEQEEPDYKVVARRIPWEEYFFDPFSREEDFSDIRYDGVAKWMDQDTVLGMYKDDEDAQAAVETSYEGPISASQSFEDKPNSMWADQKRKRLMVVELYHKEAEGWMRCVFVRGGVLEYGPSPYVDDQGKPLNPIEKQAYARDRDNMPYGAVRDLRSPQDGYNRRQSKLLHMLNVRQTFGSKSAVQDVDKVRRELARPDGHVEIEHGEFGRDFGVIPLVDQVAGQFQLLGIAEQQLLRLAPTPALLGREGQGKSGVAMENEQSAGLTELADAFGGITDWELRVFRQCWARARQFWTNPRWIRISDDLGAPQYLQVNEPAMDAMGNPVLGPDGQPQMQNRLAEAVVDITIDVTPESPTQDHQQYALLGDMIQKGLPIPPEEVIKVMPGLRNKQQMVEGIQKMREMQSQQPNPDMEKIKLEAAKAHEAQNIERQKADDDHKIKIAELELEREKLAFQRMELDFRARELESRERVEMEKIKSGAWQAEQALAVKREGEQRVS